MISNLIIKGPFISFFSCRFSDWFLFRLNSSARHRLRFCLFQFLNCFCCWLLLFRREEFLIIRIYPVAIALRGARGSRGTSRCLHRFISVCSRLEHFVPSRVHIRQGICVFLRRSTQPRPAVATESRPVSSVAVQFLCPVQVWLFLSYQPAMSRPSPS